ncbi:hypothetical protein RRG08_034506 [Elysia crispata]|uniref:Uncharacterized protein n=1 Tax=Elysia crispata TaxID=231223 RepID=A0AAE1BAS5_9GAST|nr:hypothetical protein RRG08_034506 [Elysia crispata]
MGKMVDDGVGVYRNQTPGKSHTLTELTSVNTKDWLVQVVTSCPDRETNSRGLGKFQPRDFVKIMNDCYTVGRRQSSLNILTALSAFIDETLFIETTKSLAKHAEVTRERTCTIRGQPENVQTAKRFTSDA